MLESWCVPSAKLANAPRPIDDLCGSNANHTLEWRAWLVTKASFFGKSYHRSKQKGVNSLVSSCVRHDENPLLGFAKQRLFIPRAFREKMAERCSMVGMKTPVMDIGQRSQKSLGSQGIHNMNEMLDDRFLKIKRQPQRHEKLVDSLMMC
ncbi:hypothetical protein GGR02_002225 [Anoxybacillus voinovskiensis]|uniref:Uncharacterized protein n=1 Tax=Anoxybacteroides voinovskiense TaxID=230470 RepID=A0A840DWR8_9BACL|nr:hypothetical protein [Anoxybacillus voinovskiensis]